MKKLLVIVLVFVGFQGIAQGFSQGVNISLVASWTQTGTVTGVVLDVNTTDEKLVFASVGVKEMDLQVETDMEGGFSFQLSPGNYTLEVAFIGYESQEIPIEVKGGESLEETIQLQPLKIQSAQQVELVELYDL